MLQDAIASSQSVVGDMNSAIVAAEIEKPAADAVGTTLFRKLQQPLPQAFASFLHAADVEESVRGRFVASNSVSVGGDLADAAAEESETFGAQVGLEKSGWKKIGQASDCELCDTLIANCARTQD